MLLATTGTFKTLWCTFLMKELNFSWWSGLKCRWIDSTAAAQSAGIKPSTRPVSFSMNPFSERSACIRRGVLLALSIFGIYSVPFAHLDRLLWEIKTDLALFCLSDVRVSWSITLCNWFKWSWFSFDWQDKTLIKMREKKSKGVMGYVLQKVARLKIKNRKNRICANRLALYLKYYNTNITMCIMSS